MGAVLVIGCLVWFFTQPYRTSLLIEEVNKALARNGIYERLEDPALFSGNPAVGGQWFTLNNSSKLVFVFNLMYGGNTAACAAYTETDGGVIAILPLGSNSTQIIEELPPVVYRFYADRIEQNAQKRNGGKKP
jgi:hypothetical protein